jgi:hypothetical protein
MEENNMEKTLESEIQAWIRNRFALSNRETSTFDQLKHLVELNKAIANYTEIITAFDPMIISVIV